jgi:ATP-dependent DNA helicase RecG
MLQAGVETLRGIGPTRAAQLQKQGVRTVEDLLHLLPREYRDYSRETPVSALRHGQDCAVRVRLISSPATAYFQGRSLVSVQATDATGKLRLKWFNQPYRRGQLQPGGTYVACGRVDARKGLSMLNPSLCRELPGLLPVYPLVQGLTQRFLRTAVAQALPAADEIFDPFPPALRAENGLYPRAHALVQAHRPDGPEALRLARRTLAFEDLLCYLLAVELLKQERRRFTGISFLAEGARKRYLGKLPFTPTEAQLRVMDEIERDMAAPFTMNRLLQGDVGSGKTAVALYALYIAVENGYQGVLMAPTEILARQHYDSLLGIFGSSACLLHGGMPKSQREKALARIENGEARAVVGTHALLQEDVRFAKLGLVVTDEQHRFGVSQRAAIANKGVRPDVLVMSATPIPRTLSLLLYGDLDVSVIDEMPAGRKPVKTSYIPAHRRDDMYAYLMCQAKKGVQSYVVCPFIDESEALDGVSAEGLFAELQDKLPGVRLGLLHGRMSGKRKAAVVEAFRDGQIDILVTTTVIEVGIHVPNASIMVVEGADRFGLAQLHQLRGRVGRDSAQAYCFLLSDNGGDAALRRLSVMAETNDGFLIAERDLEQRGPGDFYGTRQHGANDVLAGCDLSLLEQAAHAARSVMELPNAANDALLDFVRVSYAEQSMEIAMN